jgi:hypothetical protein
LRWAVRDQERPDDADENEAAQDDRADDRGRVAPQPLEGFAPKAFAALVRVNGSQLRQALQLENLFACQLGHRTRTRGSIRL